MRRLNTIQKREKLNAVYAMDAAGIGGAHHHYAIVMNQLDKLSEEQVSAQVHNPDLDVLVDIIFQNGPRRESDSIHGVIDTDLLEIVRDRLKGFQNGGFATEENAHALVHIEEALMWLNRRVEDRIERNVLGTSQQ